MRDCVMCGSPVPATSRGVTCGYSCRAKLREQRKTEEWRKPRQYPAELVELVRNLYVDQGMTVSEVQAEVGSGIKVQRLMENHNIPRRPTVKRDQRGDRNDSWRGDEASYAAAHTRLYSALGAAALHQCVDCDRRAQDWSYQGGCPNEKVDTARGCRYSTDPNRYVPRCRSCHLKHDRRRNSAGQFMGRKEAS